MSYYCNVCNQHHDGYPHMSFMYPDEYLHLNDARKNDCEISKTRIIIPHKDHEHHYMRAFYPQKVKFQGDDPWVFEIWIMVNQDCFYRSMDERLSDFHGFLMNQLPWYKQSIIGIPMYLEYDIDAENYIVKDILVNNLVEDDFSNGLDYELAEDFADYISKSAMICHQNRMN